MSAAMFFTYLRNCGTSLLPSLSASLSPSPLLRRFRRVSSSSAPLQSIHILGESCRFSMALLNYSIENSTLDCPIYTKDSEYWMEFINFWVGGVVQTLFILFGFVGKFVKEVKEHNAKKLTKSFLSSEIPRYLPTFCNDFEFPLLLQEILCSFSS